MDDIRIYNRALNALEIDSLLHEQNPTLSINQTSESAFNISLYPNPSTTFLQISSTTQLNTIYSIVGLSGHIVTHGKITGSSTMLNIETLDNGVYFLRIGENNITNLKFIKN